MVHHLLLTVAALAAPVDAQAAPPGAPAPRVWNGDLVGRDEHRAVVALVLAGQQGDHVVGGTFCSGTLVHPEWVVTAAHCLDEAESLVGGGYGLYVGFGSSFPYDQLVPWDAYAIPPDYDADEGAGAGDDIGLVRLARPVRDEPLVRVNEVPLGVQHVGLPVTVVGYGVTGDGREDSGTKRSAELPLIRFERDLIHLFNGTVAYDRGTGQYEVVRYDGDQNACQGDSGGASLAPTESGELVLVGVNAIVFPGCDAGGTGSTRTDLHAAWIRAYVPLDEEVGVDPQRDDPYTLEPMAPGRLPVPDLGAPPTPEEAGVYDAPLQPAGCASAGAGSIPWAGLLALLARRRRAAHAPAK